RYGLVPVAPDSPSEARTEMVLTPGVQAAVSGELWEQRVRYEPRFFWRLPNELGRPLLLHQGAMEGQLSLSRRMELLWGGYVDWGEMAYGAARYGFGGPDTVGRVLASAGVVEFFRWGMGTGLRWSVSRGHDLSLRLAHAYTGPPPGQEPLGFLVQ